MSMGAEVDAEVDLGPLVFELMGGLKASLDTLNKHLRNIAKVEAAYQGGVVEVPIRKVATSPASGSLVIGCGGPAYNRLWEVKRLTVGGVTWATSVNGSALVVVGSVADGSVNPPLTDIADQAGTLPNVAYYSTRQLVVRHPNHLFVVILTPTATTQYAVGGQASDFPDRRVSLETEN
jgi:hypothetical protein